MDTVRELGMDLIQDLDIHPFTQFVWRGTDKQLEWSGRLKTARSLHDAAEYEMVRQGHRKCATVHLTPRSYDQQIERIMRDGLVWLPIQRTQTYAGFSHKHFPVQQLDMNSTVYGVLARNVEDAEAFREASGCYRPNHTDHEAIGKLLGFPPCCTEFFNNIWAAGYYDPLWQAAMNTPDIEQVSDTHLRVGGTVHANQFMRYIGLRITSHFPCSLECTATKEIGEVWVQIMREIDPIGTDALLDLLRIPLTWSCYRGVAIVTTDAFIASTNSMPTAQEYIVEFATVN